MPRFRERTLDRPEEEVVDGARVAKPDFELLGMRVDVDLEWIERQVQEPGRMPSAIAHVAIAEAHGTAEQAIAHHSAIHVEVLPVRLRARLRRQADPAFEGEPGLRERDESRLRDEILADEPGDARLALVAPDRGRQRKLLAPVVRQGKCHVEARQGEPCHGPQHVLELRRLCAQELPPRWHAVKEVAHLDRRSLRMRRRSHLPGLAIDRLDLRCFTPFARAGAELEARHGGDRRQCFAAKAERSELLEIIQGGDLARGMACERQVKLIGRDAVTVVANADQADSAVLDVDGEALRAGVESVLDELLDHGRRALDDLARSDLVDERALEDPDGHGVATAAPVQFVSRTH